MASEPTGQTSPSAGPSPLDGFPPPAPLPPLGTYEITRAILAVAIVMPLVAGIAVILRFVARTRRDQFVGVDDWAIVVGWVCLAGMAADSIFGVVAAGEGLPPEILFTHPELILTNLKVVFADVLISLVGLAMIKVSVILFYKRIFNLSDKFRLAANLSLGAIAAWWLTFLFANLFGVNTNPADNWNPIAVATRSDRAAKIQIAAAVTYIILDLTVLCLPLPVIKKLQMSRKRKILVSGLFLLGGFCVITSIVRFGYAVQFAQDVNRNNINIAYLSMWSRIEVACVIIAACLPTFSVLFSGSRFSQLTWFSSIRSLFSIRSRTASQSRRPSDDDVEDGRTMVGKSSNSNNTRRAWHELKPVASAESNEITTPASRG